MTGAAGVLDLQRLAGYRPVSQMAAVQRPNEARFVERASVCGIRTGEHAPRAEAAASLGTLIGLDTPQVRTVSMDGRKARSPAG